MATVRNKTRAPLKVPLPRGKTLFLGPAKSGEVAPGALDHPPLLALVEDGRLEIESGGHRCPSGRGRQRLSASEGHRGGTGLFRSGDR